METRLSKAVHVATFAITRLSRECHYSIPFPSAAKYKDTWASGYGYVLMLPGRASNRDPKFGIWRGVDSLVRWTKASTRTSSHELPHRNPGLFSNLHGPLQAILVYAGFVSDALYDLPNKSSPRTPCFPNFHLSLGLDGPLVTESVLEARGPRRCSLR